MTRPTPVATFLLFAVILASLMSGCIKDTTFNPYAKPEDGRLDQLQTTINDRQDLESATKQLAALDTQIRSVIGQFSPQTVIGPSTPTPDRGCVDPYVHNIGDSYTIQQIAARPTPTTDQFAQITTALQPILAAANFTPNTPANSGTLAWTSADGASIRLINSVGKVLLYEYSTGCRLPNAWRTGPPPPDRRPIDDPDVHYPYLVGSGGGRQKSS